LSAIKISDKYKPLWEENTRYYVITGGRGSAKSFTVNTWAAQKTFQQRQRILFTRYTMVSARISIIPEFEEKIDVLDANQYFNVNNTEITNTATGSDIIFKGIKTSQGTQTANLKSLQGVSVWVLDEAEELVDETTFDKIDDSIRVKHANNIVIIILNPTTKEHWIYKRFFEDAGVIEGYNGQKDNVTYIHTSYKDNIENLSDSYIQKIALLEKNNPIKYNHVFKGGWLDKAEGVIFNYEIGEFDKSLTYGFGQDYGFFPDPTTLVKVAIDTKQKKIYLHECFYLQNLSTQQIKDNNLKNADKRDLIIGDNAEKRIISELSNSMNIKPCIKGPDSIRAGIIKMLEYTLVITPESTNLRKEFNNYCWSDKKSNTPIDDFNHLIDAARYYISYKLIKPKQAGITTY
jgi:phage terminase large subunit